MANLLGFDHMTRPSKPLLTAASFDAYLACGLIRHSPDERQISPPSRSVVQEIGGKCEVVHT
jgi:hypothetical protein